MKSALLLFVAIPALAAVDFESQVWPLLRERCVECHGAKKQKGGLRLDGREFAFKGGDDGAAIVAGKPDASPILQRVTSADEDEVMPPKGERLRAGEMALLRGWIAQGAAWPEHVGVKRDDPAKTHWAFQPVKRPAVAGNAIDTLIGAKLAQSGLAMTPAADRRTLIRRLSFDLLGLPPTPERVEKFVADRDPLAYEKLVDELLASRHYGERQARHWLDVVRFTESDGFEDDMQRKEAWTYRDYVIDAFNDDVPYDQFVREQIAGDVMKPVTARGIAATGFLVAGPWDAVQRVTPSPLGRLQSREEQLEEIVGAVAQTFLGLTVQCARCHDHKFDPIPQADYYRLKAAIEGVDHGALPRVHGVRRMLGDAEDAEWVKATAPLRARLDVLARQISELDRKLKAAKEKTDAATALNAERTAASAERDKAQRDLVTKFPVTLAFTGVRGEPKPTVIFARGDVKQRGESVVPAGLSVLREPAPDFGLAPDAPEGERRIRFAAWLSDARNPLAARVMVNRVWQQHFGTGFVDTPSDFGVNGGRPSHPELLDWLASEFVARGWSVKALHRLIVTSATYRQGAGSAAPGDADDRLLSRFPPRRLEGEVVRDAMLAMSGALNPQIGGPSFKPFTVTQLNTYFYHLFDKDEPDFNRRTIYRMQIITGRSPFLDALDCPSPSITTPRRRATTTPLQALALMNDSFAVRQAEKLAQRIAGDVTTQVARAFEIVFLRPPRPDELAACVEVAREHGLATVCWTLVNASEFLYLR
ncbi:MAG: PSD1 and planctomycete cytochrome C domain-containing protein [Chthoniobacteraceae bacterium]